MLLPPFVEYTTYDNEGVFGKYKSKLYTSPLAEEIMLSRVKTALDDEGRFALAVVAGTYTVVLGGSGGWVRLEVP